MSEAKLWRVRLSIGDYFARAYVLARHCEKVSHDRIVADNVIIDFPGDVIDVYEQPPPHIKAQR